MLTVDSFQPLIFAPLSSPPPNDPHGLEIMQLPVPDDGDSGPNKGGGAFNGKDKGRGLPDSTPAPSPVKKRIRGGCIPPNHPRLEGFVPLVISPPPYTRNAPENVAAAAAAKLFGSPTRSKMNTLNTSDTPTARTSAKDHRRIADTPANVAAATKLFGSPARSKINTLDASDTPTTRTSAKDHQRIAAAASMPATGMAAPPCAANVKEKSHRTKSEAQALATPESTRYRPVISISDFEDSGDEEFYGGEDVAAEMVKRDTDVERAPIPVVDNVLEQARRRREHAERLACPDPLPIDSPIPGTNHFAAAELRSLQRAARVATSSPQDNIPQSGLYTSPKKAKYYVVWVGRKTGVYDRWYGGAQDSTNRFPGSRHRSFRTIEEATAAYNYPASMNYLGRMDVWDRGVWVVVRGRTPGVYYGRTGASVAMGWGGDVLAEYAQNMQEGLAIYGDAVAENLVVNLEDPFM